MAGLLAPWGGEVLLEGQPVNEPPAKLAVVFQDYSRSLMPWMSVTQNVALPLRSTGYGKREQATRSKDPLAAVGLTAAATQYPWQLSGAMQQQVAIARALDSDPDALIID